MKVRTQIRALGALGVLAVAFVLPGQPEAIRSRDRSNLPAKMPMEPVSVEASVKM